MVARGAKSVNQYCSINALFGEVVPLLYNAGMLVILDRDGVINAESEAYVKTPAEWLPIPGSLAAIAALSAAGHRIVVATNQAGVGRGYYSEDTLSQIHVKMQKLVTEAGGSIERIYYCPHHPDQHCHCRKPKPGMLETILRDTQVSPADAVMIGDSERDWRAAHAVNVPFILVKTGYGAATLAAAVLPASVPVYADLQTAVTQSHFFDTGVQEDAQH